MAKKKKKAAKGKPAKRYKATGQAGKPKGKGKVKRGVRSQVLPGMEQVRSRKLDNLCEGIADCRGQKNAAVTEEKSLDASALQVMVQQGITVYRHGGVELARIPGAEKLRVRMTKEEGDAGAEDLEPSDAEIEADEQHEADKLGDGGQSAEV